MGVGSEASEVFVIKINFVTPSDFRCPFARSARLYHEISLSSVQKLGAFYGVTEH